MGQWTLGELIGNLRLNCFPSVILTLFCQPQAFSGFLNLTALKKKTREEPVSTFGTKVGQENVIFLLTPYSKACSRRHGGPGAHMRGHRLASGKEETHGIQGTIEARAEALLRWAGAEVERGRLPSPYPGERDLQKEKVRLANYTARVVG